MTNDEHDMLSMPFIEQNLLLAVLCIIALATLAALAMRHWGVEVKASHMWLLLRRILGWLCMLIGVLGVILPVIPGLPFFFIGVVLLGKRDPLLRLIILALKRRLCRWARLPGVRGRIGRWGRQLHRELRVQMLALEQRRARRRVARRNSINDLQ